MTAEVALRLGRAVARRFGRAGRHGRIVIGKDTRLSGYMLESALQAGIVSAGADVMLVGPLPTPGIAFITWSMRADAGVVISASHNPYRDNGIKVFSGQGQKLPDALEAGLRGSDAIVAILSASNARRPNTLFELGVALGTGKRLIPIVPGDLDSSFIPFELWSRRYLTKGAPAEAAREVAEALKGKAA